MRIISAFTDRTESLLSGTPEQQRQAQRERQAAEVAHAIIATKEELRRTDLEFGPRWIEHTPTGRFLWIFGGDPFMAPGVEFYYVTTDGRPVMLEAADPPSRTEMEARQARRKQQRRLEREDAAKERYRQLRETAR